jgi:hypothetical protein
MDKAGVNHTFCGRGPVPQALQILQITAMHFGPRRRQHLRSSIGSGETEHFMTGFDELLNDRRADKTRGPCDKNTHLHKIIVISNRF